MVIKWSDFAKSNLEDFVRYSKLEEPKEYVNALVNSISKLKEFPESGKVLFCIRKIETRQLIYKMHRVIYRICDNEVHIGAVIHSSKDLESTLKFVNRYFN